MIHAYKLNGCNIVLDVYSGAVHLVDEIAYDVITKLDAGVERETIVAEVSAAYGVQPDEVRDILADVDELTAAGKLFTEDIYADKEFDY